MKNACTIRIMWLIIFALQFDLENHLSQKIGLANRCEWLKISMEWFCWNLKMGMFSFLLSFSAPHHLAISFWELHFWCKKIFFLPAFPNYFCVLSTHPPFYLSKKVCKDGAAIAKNQIGKQHGTENFILKQIIYCCCKKQWVVKNVTFGSRNIWDFYWSDSIKCQYLLLSCRASNNLCYICRGEF